LLHCVNLRMTPFPRKRVAMEYLNRAVLDAVAEDAFRNRQPYPWTNLETR